MSSTAKTEGEGGARFDHAVVWIDHHVARIVNFDRDHSTMTHVQAPHAPRHLHHKANAIDSGHAPEDQAYLHEVARALSDAEAVLVTGPASEKLELVKHIERHDPTLRRKVVAVQAMDHPTDGELLAHAREFFRAADRLRPQR